MKGWTSSIYYPGAINAVKIASKNGSPRQDVCTAISCDQLVMYGSIQHFGDMSDLEGNLELQYGKPLSLPKVGIDKYSIEGTASGKRWEDGERYIYLITIEKEHWDYGPLEFTYIIFVSKSFEHQAREILSELYRTNPKIKKTRGNELQNLLQ